MDRCLGLFPDPENGPYQLLERIGRGGTGEVFRARDIQRPRREICIKRIAARFSTVEAYAEMREEARLLEGVRHANVIGLEAFGEDNSGAPYLVLEFVPGTDLGNLRGEAWDYPLAVHVACAVLRALAAVQRATAGLVHRDVSPQNILVSTEGEVKLADFGIALTEGRARWTLPGCVKGKCGYMAPEQIRGERLDGTTDLFAVGVVLYELLTGVRPCDPRRGMDELHATVRGQGVPLKIRAPELPPVLSEAVDRLLSPDREARFRHPEEAVLALAAFGAGDAGPIILGQKVRTRTHSGSKVKTESCTIPMETGVLHA